jgi:hypothetical protein
MWEMVPRSQFGKIVGSLGSVLEDQWDSWQIQGLIYLEELIDPILHQWRTDLVRTTFLAPDADLILQIPLRRSIGED